MAIEKLFKYIENTSKKHESTILKTSKTVDWILIFSSPALRDVWDLTQDSANIIRNSFKTKFKNLAKNPNIVRIGRDMLYFSALPAALISCGTTLLYTSDACVITNNNDWACDKIRDYGYHIAAGSIITGKILAISGNKMIAIYDAYDFLTQNDDILSKLLDTQHDNEQHKTTPQIKAFSLCQNNKINISTNALYQHIKDLEQFRDQFILMTSQLDRKFKSLEHTWSDNDFKQYTQRYTQQILVFKNYISEINNDISKLKSKLNALKKYSTR